MKKASYLTIRTRHEIRRIKISEIIAIVGESYLATFICESTQEHFSCSKSLKELEAALPNNHYFRISRSAVININKIISINTAQRKVVLHGGNVFPVSVRRLKDLIECLSTLN